MFRRITSGVSGMALLTAAFAVFGAGSATAVEVGPDDFRISSMGPNLTAGYEAQQSKIAYSATSQEYLVVWRGDNQGDGQAEIYGQLIDAVTGAEIGSNDFLVARIGTLGDAGTDAISPAVAWNSARNEFVVAFAGDATPDLNPPIIVDTFEIYAQRVSSTGALLGSQVRASDMGSADNLDSYDAFVPEIAYDPVADEFMTVWQGDDNTAPLVNNENEIFGQRLGYDGGGNLVEVGPNDVRLSDMGVDGDPATDARNPSVAFNSTSGEYDVVWEGNDDPVNTGVFRIYGQRVSAAGAEVGTNDFAISTAPSDEAYTPDVAVDASGNQLVVWQGDNGAPNEFEIYGQRLTSTGAAIGGNVALSAMGPAGDNTYIANAPAVAYDPSADQYEVVWTGDHNAAPLVNDEYEVFAMRLNADGTTAEAQSRISTMGVDGVVNTTVGLADVAYSGAGIGAYGVVWQAENQPTTAAGEAEIWGQFVAPTADLQITSKTLTSAASPAPGDPVSYQITYSNLGPVAAQAVTITDAIPAGVTITNVATTGPALSQSGGYVWTLPSLASGAGGTITLTGTVDSAVANGVVITNTATISTTSLLFDPPANNSKSATLTVDAPPTVAITPALGQPDPTNVSPITFSATFSEPVTGFTAADVTLGGSAGAGTAVVTGGPTVYTVAVSGMSGDGSVIASVNASAAVDAGGATNVAGATSTAVAFDATAPTVTIDQGAFQNDPTNVSPVSFDVVFSEPVSGFTGADVSLSASTVGGALVAAVTPITPSTYTVSVTGMTGTGSVVATIPGGAATDAAGNASQPSTSTDNTVTFDATVPTVTIDQALGQADPTNNTPIAFDVVFSEPVIGFATGDVNLSGSAGATTALVTGSGTTYSVAVSGMTGAGQVIASIPGSVATDLVGNANAASTSLDNTVAFDATAPSVTINQAAGQLDPTNASPIVFDVVFSEPVSGFAANDVQLAGTAAATTASVTGAGTTYSVSVSGMTGSGTVIASIIGSAATDAAGNPSAASTSTDNTVTYDTSAPSVVINQGASQADPTNGAPIIFDVTFSKAVSGFTAADVDVSASTVGGTLAAVVSGSGATYTVSVSGMTGAGSVIARVPSGAAVDGAGNSNTASTSTDNTVTFDAVAPTMTINQAAAQPDPTNGSSVTFDVVFSELVTGFDVSDVTLLTSGTVTASVSAVSGNAGAYTVLVTGVSGNGTLSAVVAAGAAVDAAGNASGASTSTDNTVNIDTVAPTVTIDQAAAQADPTNASPIAFDVVFSEPVAGFTAADVALSGSAGATTTVVSGSGTTYTLSVSGMTGGGTVVASIVSGAASDVAGNASTSSSSVDNVVTFIPGDPNPGVNDPPVITAPISISAEASVATQFSGPGAISIFDPDALSGDLTVTVSVSAGIVKAATLAGLTSSFGDGTANLSMTGPMSALNAALNGLSFTGSVLGPVTVSLTANDLGHTGGPPQTASDLVTITVLDTTAPTIVAPTSVNVHTEPGQAGAHVSYSVTITDNSQSPIPTQAFVPLQAFHIESATVVCAPVSGSFFPIGSTTVTCTGVDSSGNSATLGFPVNVVDAEKPVLGTISDLVVPIAVHAVSAVVTFASPAATDNSGSVSVQCAPPSGSTMPLGVTTVVCTATDPSGNSASASFAVRVLSGGLPATGGDVSSLWIALAALCAGTALIVAGRRRRAA